MSLEASGLKVVVESHGITNAADALNKLAVAGDKAEKSTKKLAQTDKATQASADKSAKTWYDLVDKVSKAKEKEYNLLQRHNNRVYAMAQAEANKMNSVMDRINQQDAAKFAKRRAQEQKQIEQLDMIRRNAAAKEYARAQADGNRLNTLMDRQRKQQEAAAKASAERQRVMNSTYSSSSLAQQIATLQRAQSYGNLGGNVSQRYGSNVAGAVSGGELERLQRQYRQLQLEARRANATMADTHAAVRGLSGSLGALWLTYGNLLPLIAGAAVGMAIKGVVAIGADIEHTLEKIRVLAVTTTAEVDQMRKVVFELGQGVQGPKDVANALSVLTLAGLDAQEAMQGVGATLNLAVAGDVSIEKASTTLVQISTSLGYTARDFGHIADVVAKTAAASMSSVDSISGAFLSAAAVGEVYGASLQDIGLGLATVANLGIQATAAGTTLKNFYADLSKGTEKSTKTLKDMGLSLRDLKDSNGGFIDLVELVTKLEQGFAKLDPQARGEAMDKLFGERGIKTGAALIKQVNTLSTEFDQFGNVYKNKLLEVAGEIEKSAAFATTAALAMSQTATNQMKSVGNTLQVTLAKAFESIAPQIGQVARALKVAFASPEFLNGIKIIATAVANLTLFIVEHAKQIAIMVAAYAGWKIGVFAAGLITMAKSFDIAKVAARGFTASLGPLGLAITALGIAWELYGNQKNKAITDNDANAGSLDEYAKGLKDAAIKEAEALRMRKAGTSELEIARKEQLASDKAASAKLVEASAEGVRAMKLSLDQQYSALSENEKKRAQMIRNGEVSSGSRNTVNYLDTVNKYMGAYNKHLDTVKDIQTAEHALFRDRQENGRLADEAAKKGWIKPTGTGELGGGDMEKAAQKAAKFHQNESLELNKLAAGYEAKNAAMRQSIELGKHVAAEAQQAIVLENLAAGKYGSKSKSNVLYQSQLRLAVLADEAKAENEKLKKVNEFATKIAELEAAQKAYNVEATEGSMTHFGALRKEAEGLIQVVSMSEQAADALRKRADAMDTYKKQQEAIVKLNSAADSSRNRAEEAKEEAETMLKYGENTKLGAMAVAELVIQKSKLDDITGKIAKSALREAAATEQLNSAYNDLLKQQIDINKASQDAQAESRLIFASSEAEKVSIANETRKKLLAIEYQKAQDAYIAKETSGTARPEDFETYSKAYNAYIETSNKSDRLASMETNNLKLKDWKKTIDDIEQIGREGFYNLTEKGTSLWKSMATTFKSMFKTTVMDYIYKEFAKPLMLKVIASVAGFIGADDLSNAANAMGGDKASSITGTATKLYDIFKGGGKFESTISKSVSTGFEKLGFSSSNSATAGKWAGTAGNIVAGYTAGSTVNKAISGGYETGNGFMKAEKIATAAASAVFGPIGGAVAGAVSGLVNRAFGRKPKEITSEGIRGTISSDTTSGQSYSDWMQKGGWFRSDKKGTDTSALNSDIVNSFTSGLNEMKASSYDFAKNLGINSTELQGYTKAFDIKLTDDAEANQKAISDFFVSIGDEMATRLIPNISAFAKQGESASQTMERLSSVFATTQQVADILGRSVQQMFGQAGLGSAGARSLLVDLSGGVDSLAQKTTAYMNAIYTDSQKLEPVQKALSDAMASLGYSGIKTKQQFKAVVDGLQLTDEASIRTFNALLELAPAFGQVADAAEAVAKESASSMTSAIDRLKEFGNSIRDFRNGLVLGNLSTLTPEQKLAAAASQYQTTLQKAVSGDENAQGNLTNIAQAYLEAGRTLYASSDAYSTIFDKVQSDLDMTSKWADTEVSVMQKQLDALSSIDNTLNNMFNSSGGFTSSATPVVSVAATSQGGNRETSEAVALLTAAVAQGNENVVAEIRKLAGATYDSNFEASNNTVAGVSEAIKSSSNKTGTYVVAQR